MSDTPRPPPASPAASPGDADGDAAPAAPPKTRIKSTRQAIALIGRLLAFARPFKKQIALLLFAALVAGACEAGRVPVLKFLLEDVFHIGTGELPTSEEDLAKSWDYLQILAAITFGLAILAGIFGFIHRYLSRALVVHLLVDLQNRLGQHLLSLSLKFYAAQRQGDLYARLGSDIFTTQRALQLLFTDVLVRAMVLIPAVVIAFWASWQLSLLLLILAPAVVVPLQKFGKAIRRGARSRQRSVAGVYDALQQMLTGIRTVKAFHGEEHAYDHLRDRNDVFLKDSLGVVRARVLSRSVVDAINNLLVPVVIIAGGWLVLEGASVGVELPVANLAGFIMAIIMMYEPAKAITQSYNTLQETLAGAERVFEILDTEADLQDAPDAVGLDKVESEIRFENVSFAYGDEPVLQDIELTAPVGKIAAIVGPTGAGKSTMLDMIPRFYDTSSGRVTIDGVDVRKIKRAELLRHIAVVSQDPFLFNESILDNIRYGRPDATREEVEAAAKAANVHEEILAQPDGYETVVGERGSNLSGGQRQRVTIARAILRDASILILDEATSSLDSESEKLVQDALDRLMEGRTTFVIAHRLSTVRNAHLIIALEDGRVVEKGPHEELLEKKGLYHRLYTMQQLDGGDGTAPTPASAAADDAGDEG